MDVARSLYLELMNHGCRCWLDAMQENVTVSGMREGVRNSDRLLLILTKNVLLRPFCIMEIDWALKNSVRILCVYEDDPRLASVWNIEKWKEQKQKPHHRSWMLRSLSETFFDGNTKKAKDVLKRVEMHIEQIAAPCAIPFRRRTYENVAMIREILRQSRLVHKDGTLETRRGAGSAASKTLAPVRVRIICKDVGVEGSEMESIFSAFVKRGGVDRSSLATASDLSTDTDACLILLRPGALTKPVQSQISRVLKARTRIVIVHEGWVFNSPEQNNANADVQELFFSHLLLTYRSEGIRYEHEALLSEVHRLLTKPAVRV